jgi:hypothetical protein
MDQPVQPAQPTAKQYLDDVKAAIDVIEKDFIDPVTGQFKTSVSVTDLQTDAPDVESLLKQFGLHVPASIDEALAAVGVLLKFIK